MTAQTTDPFAMTSSSPSVSFKDAPIGTSYTGKVVEAPQLVQARDYESGDPAFWPDGNPKMTVVTKLLVNGEERSLWAPKPSAMFAAIAKAQQDAGASIQVGGTLTVTYVGDKPNEKNPRLNPAKQYEAKYVPADAFAETSVGTVNTSTGEVQQAVPAPQQAAAPAPAAPAGPTPEQVAAVKAAGIDPATVFPGYTG